MTEFYSAVKINFYSGKPSEENLNLFRKMVSIEPNNTRIDNDCIFLDYSNTLLSETEIIEVVESLKDVIDDENLECVVQKVKQDTSTIYGCKVVRDD